LEVACVAEMKKPTALRGLLSKLGSLES
jgi:hypothetical protein